MLSPANYFPKLGSTRLTAEGSTLHLM